jgi:hypothetical protein
MSSSAALQREAERTRRNLSSTLDDLRDSATPGRLTTEAMHLAKDSSVAIMRALADTARHHPLPALLIGAGLAMMLTGDRKSTPHDAAGEGGLDQVGKAIKNAAQAGMSAVRGAAEQVGSVAATASTAVKEAAVGAATAVKDAGVGAADSVREAASSVAGKVGEGTQKATESATGAADSARAQVDRLSVDSQKLVGQARDAVSKLIDEQPLIAATLGIALGTAIGAAIPATAAEREYLGRASARVRKAGGEILSKVTEAATTEAKAQGLDPGAVRDLAQNVGSRFAAVAEQAVDSLSRQVTPTASDARKTTCPVCEGTAEALGTGSYGKKLKGPSCGEFQVSDAATGDLAARMVADRKQILNRAKQRSGGSTPEIGEADI